MRLIKSTVLVLFVVAVCLNPIAAKADQVDFAALGGTWLWDSTTNTVGATGTTVFAAKQPTPNTPFLLSGATLAFTTGLFTGTGNGTLTNPWTFASGGSVDVLGGTCGAGCFLGSFTNVQLFNNGAGSLSLQGAFVGGSLSPALLSLLGFPAGTPTNAVGTINTVLSPNATGPGSGGNFNSANLVLTPTPVSEPSALLLLGAGLIGISLLTRRLAVRQPSVS